MDIYIFYFAFVYLLKPQYLLLYVSLPSFHMYTSFESEKSGFHYFQCVYLFLQSPLCNLSSDHVGHLLISYDTSVKNVLYSLTVG